LTFLLQLRQRVEEKNRLLRHMAAAAQGAAIGLGGGGAAAAGAVDLSAVTQRWDGFTASLQQVRRLSQTTPNLGIAALPHAVGWHRQPVSLPAVFRLTIFIPSLTCVLGSYFLPCIFHYHGAQFDTHLESQRATLKGVLQRRLQEFQGDIAGAASRCGWLPKQMPWQTPVLVTPLFPVTNHVRCLLAWPPRGF
jgi:hypothetical protein